MREMYDYIIKPLEKREITLSIKKMIMVVLLLFIINIFFVGCNVLLRNIFEYSPVSARPNLNEYNLFFLLLVPPLLEELAFRLPLKRIKINFLISSFVIGFFLASKILSENIYSLENLFFRLLTDTLIGVILFFFTYKIYKSCEYRYIFFFYAFLFAVPHMFNYEFSFSLGYFVIMTTYLSNKLISGLLYGYARMQIGFVFSASIHVLMNLFPILFLYYGK